MINEPAQTVATTPARFLDPELLALIQATAEVEIAAAEALDNK